MAKAILIPQCSRPRRTGTYVIEYKGIKALAFVRQESQGLYVHWSVSGTGKV